MTSEEKERRSYSLKLKNISKVEKIAYENKRKKSNVVDEMIEEFEDGD
jgi:hypothetical protein